jgi:anti-sigma factor RsiW
MRNARRSQPVRPFPDGQPVTDTHLSSEELAAYLDARTSRPESKRIVGHLAVCDACFKELLEVLRLMKDQQEMTG